MCDYEMFNHGQTISFGDGQQAIILQSPDQSGAPQSKTFVYYHFAVQLLSN